MQTLCSTWDLCDFRVYQCQLRIAIPGSKAKYFLCLTWKARESVMDSIGTPFVARPISTPIHAMDSLSVAERRNSLPQIDGQYCNGDNLPPQVRVTEGEVLDEVMMMSDVCMDTGGQLIESGNHVMDSRGLVLPSLNDQVIQPSVQGMDSAPVSIESRGLPQIGQVIMDSGNHSSEEELEEYITHKKSYLSPGGSGTEKRKWSDLSQSDGSYCSDTEFEDLDIHGAVGHIESTDGTGSSSSTTPSGEEDVNHNIPASIPTPVQFSTSPPTDVHKPRRSISPQQKLFPHIGQEHPPERQTNDAPNRHNRVPTRHPLSREEGGSLGRQSSSRQDSSLLQGLPSSSSMTDLPALARQEERRERRAISPRKRSRTSRVYHIQRPCLDFEKMQQLRAKNLTSWRHGGELSLFCW